jgi:penicillin-insensitive murein endopeptidase
VKYFSSLCLTALLFSSAVMASPWTKVSTPTLGETEAIGSYSNGCLSGAEALPLSGEGYQVMRSYRHRYYGHPEMVQFLEHLAKETKADGLGQLLVGDIAMPRGGRFASGHASHQIGLDADIWLRLPSKPLTTQQLKDIQPYPMVDLKNYKIRTDHWTNKQADLIKLAAEDPQVARIFVNPVIKEQLCKTAGNDRDWLRKVRPWWGHYYHFHVRLACPKGSMTCVSQAPPPKGDGCGTELASWSPHYKAPINPNPKPVVKKPKPPKVLPSMCKTVLDS